MVSDENTGALAMTTLAAFFLTSLVALAAAYLAFEAVAFAGRVLIAAVREIVELVAE